MNERDVQKQLRGVWIPTDRHIRVEFEGEIIADSTNAMLLRDSGAHLFYFFPEDDVRMDLLIPTDHATHSGWRGDTKHWTVAAGSRQANNAAWTYENIPEDRPDTGGYITFDWDAMDAWYEETVQVYVHPRDPFHRVDAIPSNRHVRVEIDGTTIAETENPVALFETGIHVRYYIPPEDVRTELLTPTDLHTGCPYKGRASYWTAHINGTDYENIVWAYPDPLPGMPYIDDMFSFYFAKHDGVEIYVNDVKQE